MHAIRKIYRIKSNLVISNLFGASIQKLKKFILQSYHIHSVLQSSIRLSSQSSFPDMGLVSTFRFLSLSLSAIIGCCAWSPKDVEFWCSSNRSLTSRSSLIFFIFNLIKFVFIIYSTRRSLYGHFTRTFRPPTTQQLYIISISSFSCTLC